MVRKGRKRGAAVSNKTDQGSAKTASDEGEQIAEPAVKKKKSTAKNDNPRFRIVIEHW